MKKFRINVRVHYKKTLISVMAITAALSVLCISVIFVTSNNSLKEKIVDSEKQTVAAMNQTLDGCITQIGTIVSTFAMSDLKFMVDNTEWLEDKKYSILKSQLSMCVSMFDYLAAIHIEYNGKSLGSGAGSDFERFRQNFNCELIYEKAGISVYTVHEEMDSVYFFLDSSTNEYAVNSVLIKASAHRLGVSTINDFSENRIRLYVDKNGDVIISNRSEYIGVNVFSLLGAGYNTDLSALSQFEMIKNGGKTLYISPNFKNGLYSVILSDEQAYNFYQNDIFVRSIVIGFIILIFAMISTYVISNLTYRPIKEIVNTLDDFYPISPLESINELKYITDSISKLKQNKSETQKNLLALKQQQILALQTQISPHFLYNTLDALNWMAAKQLGIPNDVSKGILKTSKVLKAVMDMSTFFFTVESEIEILHNCTDIMKIRYDIDVETKIIADKDIMDCKILKNCTQPLVENAFQHGFDDSVKNPTLTVSIARESEALHIVIADNGKGMNKEKCEALTKSIWDFSTHSSKHIGMKNVNQRIVLLYGEKYGLKIKSEEGKGTVCSFSVPII